MMWTESAAKHRKSKSNKRPPCSNHRRRKAFSYFPSHSGVLSQLIRGLGLSKCRDSSHLRPLFIRFACSSRPDHKSAYGVSNDRPKRHRVGEAPNEWRNERALSAYWQTPSTWPKSEFKQRAADNTTVFNQRLWLKVFDSTYSHY